MRRSVKGFLVLCGWIILFLVAITIAKPILELFVRPVDGLIPIEVVVPMFVMVFAIGIPILYTAIGLITPLVMATVEVLDSEH